MREVREETGIRNMSAIVPGIFALDVLPVLSHIRRGEYIPAHLHLTAAYLLEADEAEELVVKPDENSAVKWIPIDQVNIFSNEPHMKKVYEKLITKIKCLSSRNL
jgi:ADP-ribose pyrophosphatase YjhB (NUDIX family)